MDSTGRGNPTNGRINRISGKGNQIKEADHGNGLNHKASKATVVIRIPAGGSVDTHSHRDLEEDQRTAWRQEAWEAYMEVDYTQ